MVLLSMMVVYRDLNNADSLSSLTTHTLQLYQMACFCCCLSIVEAKCP